MRQSTRLIVNALASFGRMFITFGMGLVATRIVLDVLGEVDFALLAAVGAGGAMLALISHALAFSTQRHLAFEIGGGDVEPLREVFNTVLVLFLIMAGAVLLFGVALAVPILQFIRVPAGRAEAAWIVYGLTLTNLVVTVIATPFLGLMAARQEIVFTAALGVMRAVLAFGAAIVLLYAGTDPLVLYAALLLAVNVVMSALMIGASFLKFDESRPRFGMFRRARVREIGSFASWSIVQQMASQFMQQGGVLMMKNSFASPIVAAYALAQQVSQYLANLTYALMQVVEPAVTTIEARGDRVNVHFLTLAISKYCTLMVSMIVVPLMLETDMLLDLWLKDEVPPLATTFVRLMILWLFIQQLTRGHHAAVFAQGQIKPYVLAMVSLTVMALAAGAFAFYVMHWPAWSLPAAMVGTAVLVVIWQLYYVGRLIELPTTMWVKRTLVPAMAVVCLSGVAAYGAHAVMEATLLRVACVIAAYSVVVVVAGWFIALDTFERDHFIRVARAAAGRAGMTR